MYKKIILFIFLLSISILIAQTSRFEKTFRNSDGELLTGATIYIVNQSTGDSLQLTEDATRDGVYYRANVSYGHYKIYVNNVLVVQDYFFAAIREKQFIDAVDPDGDNKISGTDALTGTAIEDSTVELKKFTTATVNYIGSAGSITNNPDDITLENKTGNTIGIKGAYYHDSVAVRIADSLSAIHDTLESWETTDFNSAYYTHTWIRDSIIADTMSQLRDDLSENFYSFNAASHAYQKGDSVLFVKSITDEWVYYEIPIPQKINTYFIVLKNIYFKVKGDGASTGLDSIIVFQNNYGAMDTLNYITTIQPCNGSNQTFSANPGGDIDSQLNIARPLMVKMKHTVNNYLYVYSFEVRIDDANPDFN